MKQSSKSHKPIQWHLLILGFLFLIGSVVFNQYRIKAAKTWDLKLRSELTRLIPILDRSSDDRNLSDISDYHLLDNTTLFVFDSNGRTLVHHGEFTFFPNLTNEIFRLLKTKEEGSFLVRGADRKLKVVIFIQTPLKKRIATILSEPNATDRKTGPIRIAGAVFVLLIAVVFLIFRFFLPKDIKE